MRPQLLGFIYKKNKDTGELILSGIRLCDLDNIIRKNTINISYEIISPALFNSGATTFAVSPQRANGSVLMDASVESVIEQLKAGVKISGLRYNAHKKNSRYKGLEGIEASLDDYPYCVEGTIYNDYKLLLDYKINAEHTRGFIISFSGMVDIIADFNSKVGITKISDDDSLYRRIEYSYIYAYPTLLVNAIMIMCPNTHRITFITKVEVEKIAKELKIDGLDIKILNIPYEVVEHILNKRVEQYETSLGYPGIYYNEFRYLVNDYIVSLQTGRSENNGCIEPLNEEHLNTPESFLYTIYDSCPKNRLPLLDIQHKIEVLRLDSYLWKIKTLYLPEHYYPIYISIYEGYLTSLNKIIGADSYSFAPYFVFYSRRYEGYKIFYDRIYNLEKIEYGKKGIIEGFLSFRNSDTTYKPFSIPKITSRSPITLLCDCCNAVEIADFIGDTIDLRQYNTEYLFYSFNNLPGIKKIICPPNLRYLVKAFEKMPDLEEVDFSNCTQLQWIDNSLNSCPNLKKVILPRSLEEIKESFRECESLSFLNLDNCAKLCSVTKSILFCSIEHVKLDVLDAIEIRYSFISLNNLRTVAIYSKSNPIFIEDSFNKCNAIESLDIPRAYNIIRCFDDLSKAKQFKMPSVISGVLKDSFDVLSLDTLNITDKIANMVQSFRKCTIREVNDYSLCSSYGYNFLVSDIGRINVYSGSKSPDMIIHHTEFLDYRQDSSFRDFDAIFDKKLQFLILPVSLDTVNYSNLCTASYLRAAYFPAEAEFRQKKLLTNLGSNIPGGTLCLVHDKSPILRFVKKRELRYQIVKSQEEAREIIEGLYREYLEEVDKADKQASKLRMFGADEELLKTPMVKNYTKLKRIEAVIDSPFDFSRVLPIKDEVLKASIPKENFKYLSLDNSIEAPVDCPCISAVLNDPIVAGGTVKSPVFRGLLNLYSHIGRRTTGLFNTFYNQETAPELVRSKFNFTYTIDGTEQTADSAIYLTAHNLKSSYLSVYKKYPSAFEAIFVEKDRVLWTCPFPNNYKDLIFNKLGYSMTTSCIEMFKLKDKISVVPEQEVVLEGVELSTDISRKFIKNFREEALVVYCKKEISGLYNILIYSLKNGKLVRLQAHCSPGTHVRLNKPEVLVALPNTLYDAVVTEVYDNLDELKEKNSSGYAAMQEFVIPKDYYDIITSQYDISWQFNIRKGVTNPSYKYDKVEQCYEYILAKYLVTCGIKTVADLHSLIMDNIFSSNLFEPKVVRDKTLKESFRLYLQPLCDGAFLAQYEYEPKSRNSPSGIMAKGLPIRAPFFLKLISNESELEKGNISGYCCYSPLFKTEYNKYKYERSILDALLMLGSSVPNKAVETLDRGAYTYKDFVPFYREHMPYYNAWWVVIVNIATGIPFIGIEPRQGDLKLLLRLKSLQIPFTHWQGLTTKQYANEHKELLDDLICDNPIASSMEVRSRIGSGRKVDRELLKDATIQGKTKITALRDRILHGTPREELLNFDVPYLDLLATQEPEIIPKKNS